MANQKKNAWLAGLEAGVLFTVEEKSSAYGSPRYKLTDSNGNDQGEASFAEIANYLIKTGNANAA
jgi:hypothetical protein